MLKKVIVNEITIFFVSNYLYLISILLKKN
jgi:hypothetical protein